MPETGDIIVIGEEDLPRVDEKTQKIRDVSRQTEAKALEKLRSTSTLADFLTWHTAVRHSEPESIGWMFDPQWEIPEVTPEFILAEYEDPRRMEESRKEAQTIEELRRKIDTLPPSDDIRVALKRMRSAHGYYNYRVLAAFPDGRQVSDWVSDKAGFSTPEVNYIYFDPANACVEHACDDLYKQHRDTQGVFRMPYREYDETREALVADKKNMFEYQLEKTNEDVVKQDPYNYLNMGLIGGYANEVNRVRVSDFWEKSQ